MRKKFKCHVCGAVKPASALLLKPESINLGQIGTLSSYCDLCKYELTYILLYKSRLTNKENNINNRSYENAYTQKQCLLCGKNGNNIEILLNGDSYHSNCYYTITSEIDRIYNIEAQLIYNGNAIKNKIQASTLYSNKLIQIFFTRSNFSTHKLLCELKSKFISNTCLLAEVKYELETRQNKLTRLYDNWFERPPDWENRSKAYLANKPRCELCGSVDFLHVHHKIPISKGGNHVPENLQTLCEMCHSIKHGSRIFSYQTTESTSPFKKKKDILQLAINTNSIIKFKYVDMNGEVSYRTVRPTGFVVPIKNLCVVGFCYSDNDIRHFAIKRITKLTVQSNK